MLTDVEFVGGIKWEASYAVRSRRHGAAAGMLLVVGKPVLFDLNQSAAGIGSGGGGPTIDRWRMFEDSCIMG